MQMTTEQTHSDKFTELRQQAEETLHGRPIDLPANLDELSTEDVQRLFHELQVHQVELEMQNKELRRAQQELEASRDRYVDLYDFGPVGYLTLSEQGMVLEANLTLATLLGVARADLLKQPLSRFIVAEDQDIYYLHRQQLFDTREPQVCELRMVRKDSAPFWARIEATIARDSEGQPVCRATVSDVSERVRTEALWRQSEKELQEERNRLQAILDNATAVIYLKDTQGRFLLVNREFERAFHLAQEQVVGMTDHDFMPQDMADVYRANDVRVLESGAPLQIEETALQDDGIHTVISVKFPMYDADGIPCGVGGISTDITERARTEAIRRQAEDALRASERTLAQAQAIAHVGSWRWEIVPDEIYWSDETFRLFGWEPGEKVNYPRYIGAVLPEDRDFVQKQVQLALDGKKPYENEHRIIRNGEIRVHHTRGIVNRDERGDPLSMVGVVQDVTEQKRAEQALRESEEKYRLMFETMASGFALLEMVYDERDRPVDCRYLEVNPAHERLTGLKTTEIIGRTAKESIPGLEDTWIENYGQVDRTGESMEIEDYVIGLDRWYRVFAYRPKPGFVAVTFDDITERKWTEDALRESEAKSRSIIEHSRDGIMLTDERGAVVEWNQGQERISGQKQSEVIGQFLWDVQFQVIPEERKNRERYEWIKDSINAFLKTGQAPWLNVPQEVSIQLYDGTQRIIQQVAFSIETDAGFRMGSTTRDITERVRTEAIRRRAEEQIKASLEEKTVMLKEIHHRVKNNMQVISSLLNMQANQIEDERLQELFRESQNRIRAMSLVHEKLYQAPDLALIDFDNYLRSLTATIFRSLHKSGIELVVKAKDIYLDVNTAIPCGLIVNELVSNALKYAFPNDRPGRIHVTCSQTAAGTFVLTVQDDGIGFPTEIDFGKTESLGLQLVNISTRQLQGNIELERGQGTAFTITFPEKGVKHE